MARTLHGLTAPTGPAVLETFLPALAATLDGAGPALLPLPTGGSRPAVIEALRPDLPLESDEVAVVVPTSGSTGEPKGVLLSADALRFAARASHRRLAGPGQWLLALPVTHVGGIQVLVRALEARIRPVALDLYGGFDAHAFTVAAAAMNSTVPRYVSLVPTQVRRLLDADADLAGFDAVLVGAAAFPDELRRRCDERGWRVVETYGMSETCGGVVYDGKPLDEVEVGLLDGRLTIGGPVVFRGYRLRPDLTAAALVAGRHVTQDLGRIDPDGTVHVLGRADDVLITGGVNVAAAAVERVLGEHPSVAACAVVGIPDAEWGDRVVAVIQPVRGDLVPTVGELRAFAAEHLEPPALPREVVAVGMLPMLASGKPDKAAVRSLVAARAS
ncbi:MAG: AMP-binding protein [Sporichthyaceae bacterium]|nr:AMP-binding protein [Sporichthyaceae bacterium]